jgi:hypothetical protein
MTMISCSRLATFAVLLAAALGATACDQQGCGQVPEETSTQVQQIVCGEGTRLQAGQCVATQGVTTR